MSADIETPNASLMFDPGRDVELSCPCPCGLVREFTTGGVGATYPTCASCGRSARTLRLRNQGVDGGGRFLDRLDIWFGDPPTGGGAAQRPEPKSLDATLERARELAEIARVAALADQIRALSNAEIVELLERAQRAGEVAKPQLPPREGRARESAGEQILRLLSRGPATTSQVVEALPLLPNSTVKSALRELEHRRQIERGPHRGFRHESTWALVSASTRGEPSPSSPRDFGEVSERSQARIASAPRDEPSATASATAKPSSKSNARRG